MTFPFSVSISCLFLSAAILATPMPAFSKSSRATHRTRHTRHAAKRSGGSPAAAKPSSERLVAGSAGMRVAIDPVTHRVTAPSPEQMQAMDRESPPALERSSEGLPVIDLPGGGQRVDLRGRFLEYAIARKDSTGKLHFDCVSTAKDAKRLVREPAPQAPTKPVEE